MNKLLKYLKESKEEFKKVTWPTRKTTLNYSFLVIFISVFLALFIGFADFILSFGLEKIVQTSPTSITQTADVNTVSSDIQFGDVQVESTESNN